MSDKFDDNKTIKELVIYYCYIYKANWDKLQKAIEEVTPVDENLISDDQVLFGLDDFITLIEPQYPNNFTNIYCPPFCLFTWGQRDLLSNPNIITSLWGKIDLEAMLKLQLPMDEVYAIKVTKDNLNELKKILRKGYKLILVSNHMDFISINKLTDEFKNNCLYLSEVPGNLLDPNFAEVQLEDRLLIGIGQKQILNSQNFSPLKDGFLYLDDPKEKKKIYCTDINAFSADEVDLFRLHQYKLRTN